MFFGFSYRNGLVKGLISVSNHVLAIYEWCSESPNSGNTVKALLQLRENYSEIIVHDIGGGPQDSSWKYWLYMRNKGFVDRLYDGNRDLIP